MSFSVISLLTAAVVAAPSPAPRVAADSNWQTAPLTMDGVKQFSVIEKKINTINTAHNIDELAKSHGITAPSWLAQPPKLDAIPTDSINKLFTQLVDYQIKVFKQPEVVTAFQGEKMTPEQYAWTRFRFQQAWQITNSIDQMHAQGIPESAIHFNHPGIPDADVAFTKENDAAIRTTFGLPALQVSSGSGTDNAAETHANPTVVLIPTNGALATQLAKEVADAKAKGELPIVEVSDRQICAPCIILDKAMERPALVETFKGTRLIKVSPAIWGAELAGLNYCRVNGGNFDCDMPRFFSVGADGKAASEGLSLNFGAGDADENAKALAPQFVSFLTPLRNAKK